MRVCYLCFSNDTHYVGKNLDFDTDIYACNVCHLIQNDFVSRRYLDCYYHYKYRQLRNEGISNTYLAFMAQRASSQNAYIKRHLSDNHALKNVLDIGAGAGKLIETFLPGSAIFAVESDQTMTTHLNMHPSICVVPESRIFENNHVGKFDLITMSHVFEHINNPIEYLYQLHKILVYNGHLFLEVPNEPEPVIRHHIKRKKKGVGHLFDYTIDTLKLMIAKSGLFDIVDIASYGVSVFDWMDGAKLNNFQENHEGDGVYIRCMLKRREVDNAYIESGYMDAVLQSRYANQFLLESKIEALHYEMSQKDQRIRRLSMALERIEGSLGSHLAGNN